MDLLGLVYPRQCLGCKKQGKYLCHSCILSASLATPICPACGRYSLLGKTHKECSSVNNLNGMISIWRYKGVIKKAIVKYKYNFVSDIASELALFASEHLKNSKVLHNAIFVPIPLHQNRFKWRGFNQSEMLAVKIGKQLSIPVNTGLLVRTKEGVNQASLDRESRLRNMCGKYAVNGYSKHLIKWNKSIVLVDDVWTTGSTLTEAARVLKEAGAKNVWGLTIAR